MSDYWFQTGVPTLLVRTLQSRSVDISTLNGAKATADMLGNLSPHNVNPIALFYQKGYLTIKGYDRATRIFRLGYPNKEAEIELVKLGIGFAESTHTIDSYIIED